MKRLGSKLIDLCEGKEIKQKQKIKKGKKNWTFRQLTGLLRWSLITKKCCKKTYMWWFDNTTAITKSNAAKTYKLRRFYTPLCSMPQKGIFIVAGLRSAATVDSNAAKTRILQQFI